MLHFWSRPILLCAKYFLEAYIFEGSYIYLYFVKQIS